MCLSRACIGIWLIEQGTLLLKRARMCSEYELLAMLTVCTQRKLFSLRMVIDSKIEMPLRFYIATRFQLFNLVKDSCFALG